MNESSAALATLALIIGTFFGVGFYQAELYEMAYWTIVPIVVTLLLFTLYAFVSQLD